MDSEASLRSSNSSVRPRSSHSLDRDFRKSWYLPTVKLEILNLKFNYPPHDPLDRFDQHPIYSESEIILKLVAGEVAQIFLYNLVGEVVVDTISTIFPG